MLGMDEYEEPQWRRPLSRRSLSRSIAIGFGVWVGAILLSVALAVALGAGLASYVFPFVVYFVVSGPLSLALWLGLGIPEESLYLLLPFYLLFVICIVRMGVPWLACAGLCVGWPLIGFAHLMAIAGMGAFA